MKCSLFNVQSSMVNDFPWLGRFLSPDPFVQSPTYSQSYNRYSYCFNNPLKYSDPSGYNAWKFEENPIQIFSSGNPGIFRINWNTNYGSDMSTAGSYNYNWSTGQYYNSSGAVVSWNEVFVNYVQPNSICIYNASSSSFSNKRNRQGPQKNQQNNIKGNNLLANIRKAILDQGGMMFNGTLDQELEQEVELVVFEIDKAINYLKAHFILPYGAGRCINHMVPALIAAGITGLDGKPIKAPCLYVPILEDLGFVIVNRTDIYYKGDIAIIQGYATGTYCKGSGVVCGHIQLFDGEHWLSDFPQDRPFWPGAGYEKYHPSFQIMHWGGN
jgi:hypothetical protein